MQANKPQQRTRAKPRAAQRLRRWTDVISHRAFAEMRLRDCAADVVDLDSWEFMGRLWVGEAIGFSEWLRPEDDPVRLGSLALDLCDLPPELSERVLGRLQLPLSRGMNLAQIRGQLGDPVGTQLFVSDRRSFDFKVDGYSISCTVHDADGLIYIVVMPLAV
jgi:hypothetical protein